MLQYAPDQIRILTRFSLVEEVPGLDVREVASFPTFELADQYRTDMGPGPKHVRRDIVDTQANVVRLKADATEEVELGRQLELARKRKELLDLQTENANREKTLVSVSAPPVAPTPKPTDSDKE
jgi:hypothetical protein